MKVVFTKENEIADNYIARFVYRLSSNNNIKVATSDYLEQTTVLSSGGTRISSRELRDEINAADKTLKEDLSSCQKKTTTIMSRVKPELLEELEKIRRGK